MHPNPRTLNGVPAHLTSTIQLVLGSTIPVGKTGCQSFKALPVTNVNDLQITTETKSASRDTADTRYEMDPRTNLCKRDLTLKTRVLVIMLFKKISG